MPPLDQGAPMFSIAAALQSGTILLREGLEALIIISALAGLLRRAHAERALTAVYTGALAAVALSFGAALVFALFFNGAHNDVIEAGVMLLAAALMFYMSGWLFLRQDSRVLMAELKASADRALDKGTFYSFALIAFLAVFREGAETILFLHALASSAGGYSAGFFAGIAGASLALAAIFVLLQWFALRLPFRPVFLVTSGLLFLMGVKFVGGGLQELQEQALVPFTPLALPDWLIDLGLNPTREALAVQVGIVLLAAIGTLVAHLRLKRQNAAAAGPQGRPA